jgi:predicted regulator of Ras-like GTPase activity (Roadblock/LC7/MglB family)
MLAQTLKEIASRLPEIDCILLMGLDGLSIEKVVQNESINIELLIAEYTTILRNTMHTSQEVSAGKLDEVIIVSDKMILLMKAITSEYFVLMILPEGGNLGKARFELKKAKYSLEKEFV